MSKKLLVLLFFIFNYAYVAGQEFQIKGRIVDATSKTPLEAATVYLESINDSTLITYSISDVDGSFFLEGKGNYNKAFIFFSYNGYKLLKKELGLKKILDLGIIDLNQKAQELDAVDIVGERVPISIKKDTLEFNADSFKTRPDATVEDVLKKLPGVEVDSEGKITVNGKEVSQVLVNGQVFFSKDPKVATKSLPKEIISKIQILDTKTKEQEFTGEAGTGETKTINLTIKEDKNKGFLGRLSGGYGTDDRYQGNGLLNYFNDTERVSVIGASNNINNAGFSFDEIYDMLGNTRGGISMNSQGGFSIGGLSFGFGQGIVTSSNLGASYARKEKNKYEIGGNYFFTYSDSYNNEKTERENILPDRSYFTNSTSSFNGSSNSNQGGADLEFDIDSTLRISIYPKLSVNRTNSSNLRNTTSIEADGELINRNNVLTLENGMQRRFTNELQVFKKLDTLGRYVRFSFENTNAENNTLGNLNSLRSVFGDTPTEELIDQQSTINNQEDQYVLGVSYRQPFVGELFLDFGYEYRNNNQRNTKQVVGFDETTNDYTEIISVQSSDFRFQNKQQLPSLGLLMNAERISFNITVKHAFTEFNNNDNLQNTSFSKSYQNMLWNMFGRYKIGKNGSVSLNMNTDLRAPSVVQLQPVINVANPLNVIIGNPNLKPTLTRNIYLNFNDYNWKERTGVFVYLGLQFDDDFVASNTQTDDDLLRTTTFENVKGNYNHYGGIGYSKQLKKDSTYVIKFNIRPYFNIQKNIGFSNGQRLETKNTSFSPRVSTSFNFREKIEIEPEYSVSFGSAIYNLEGLNDVNYLTHRFNFKTTTYWPRNIVWGNDLNYTYNSNVGPGFDKDALFWNVSLGYEFLKKKASLKVLAYDILNQNINTRRTTGEDYIQDFQGTVLQQYFMMSFTFKFDQFGGAKKRGGGVRFY